MSRSLMYRPHIPEKEQSTKDIRLMDALAAYFENNGPWILTYSDMNMLNALVAATDAGSYLIDIIEQHGAVYVRIEY